MVADFASKGGIVEGNVEVDESITQECVRHTEISLGRLLKTCPEEWQVEIIFKGILPRNCLLQ